MPIQACAGPVAQERPRLWKNSERPGEKMKAYKLEVLIVDHDEVGEEGIVSVLQNTKYPNWCISPEVKSVQGVDIGSGTTTIP
jgi:hypothetical protein